MMRKFYWYLTAYTRKHGLLVISSLAIGIAFFWFFIPTLVNNLEIRQRHYVGLIGEYTLNNLPEMVKHQLSVGLTQIKKDGSVSPALAERWTVEQDGSTYRFLLKENLRWQDGTELQPENIHYNFSDDVETIITPNDIVFKLPGPFAPFPVSVAEPIFKSAQQQYWFFFSKPTVVGIGDYEIADYHRKGNRITELIVDGQNERYIYRFYLTEGDAVTGFKRGEVNILPNLAREHDIFDWDSVTVDSELDTDRYLAVFFNNRDPRLTTNVRQALSYALEKESGDKRAIGPISPDSWAYLQGGKSYDLDWERGSERLRAELPREQLAFELTTTTLFEERAEAMKQQWEAFGEQAAQDCQNDGDVSEKEFCENLKMKISIRVNNFPDTNNFDLLLVGQEIPADPDQYQLWHSDQSTNFTGYQNTRIDNLLEQGRQTYNKQERTAIYQEFQQFILEDPPAIFLEYLETHTARRSNAPAAELDFIISESEAAADLSE